MPNARLILLAAALAVLPVAAAGAERHVVTAARTSLPPGDTAAVSMQLETGQPVVEAWLNGRGPYRMFLDTGASTTVLDSSLAAELGLPVVGTTRIGDPANPHAIAANIVRLDTLRIGGARFEGVQAASWNRVALRPGPGAPRGVIGFAVFRDLLLSLDYPGAQVRLARGKLPAADGRRVLRYTDPQGIPVISVDVAGERFEAHLDTGSPGFLSVPAADSGRVHFAGPLRELGRGRTVNSTIVFRGAALDGELRIGEHRFEHPVIMLHDQLPAANLGGRALQDFVLTFDQRAKRLRIERTRVSPPAAFLPPAPGAGKSAGVGLAPQSDGSMLVVDTLPGSAASRADIQSGDRLLKLNGVPLGTLADADRRAALRRSPVTLTLQRGDRTFDVTLEF